MSGNVFDDYELPSLKTKFVRCSVRTCVRHVEQLLRMKLSIPQHLVVQVICADRILDEWITLKQVWLSCWFTKVTVASANTRAGGQTFPPAGRTEHTVYLRYLAGHIRQKTIEFI